MSCCVMSGLSQILDYSLNQAVILGLKRTVIWSRVTIHDFMTSSSTIELLPICLLYQGRSQTVLAGVPAVSNELFIRRQRTFHTFTNDF